MKMALLVVCLVSVGLCFSSDLLGSDWTTYLGDNTRAGSTPDNLKLPLTRRWLYSSPSLPRRAWSGPEGRTIEGKELRDRVKFDDAFQVAVVGKRLYFGSSVDHALHCLDTATGSRLWSFFTGGPIRLAPTVSGGRVYFGSDDGYVYCLDAEDGRLIWKVRPGPAGEWIIGRGELISRWPVRVSVLVDDGIAYFGAGIFPHENVYLYAVDAEDGTVLWKHDNISQIDAGRNDLSPQGYLLATADRLYIPSGRSQPKAVDRKTGELAGVGSTALRFTQTAVAGTDALIADGRLHLYSLGTRLAVAGDFSYAATGRDVIRMDRKAYAAASSKRAKIASELRDLSAKLPTAGDKADEYKARIAELRKAAKNIENEGILWQTACTSEAALVVAGELVLAGGKKEVTAFANESGKEVWKTSVDGEARGLAVAGDNLFVSTTTGKIFCFASAGNEVEESTVRAPASKTTGEPYPRDKWAAVCEAAADDILKRTGITRGYCLVLGSEDGRLAYELAKRSDLKIYGVEPDKEKVAQSRRALSAAGLYGNRVTVHHADLTAIPYSNYFANLIVSDSLLRTGELPGAPRDVARHLKPLGGVAMVGRPADAPGDAVAAEALRAWLEGMELASQASIKTDESWGTLTRGALPGAGSWTHQYAEPGNTACSDDNRVSGGLGVLWYGDPGPGKMVNRHDGAVGPLSTGGRLFVQGQNSIMAYDAYNGLFLWERENPEAIRTGVYQNQNPGNLAASDDSLFMMIGDKCFQFDAATGRVNATHLLPGSKAGGKYQWGYVAYRDGLLFGTATIRREIEERLRRRGRKTEDLTDTIFAIDLETGKHLWTHQGTSISHRTIALGPDGVYFVDSSITSEQRAAILRQDKSELKKLTGEAATRAAERLKKLDVRRALALDARTGKEIWSVPVDVTDCSDIGIGGGKLSLMYRNGVLVLCGANANGHYWRQFVNGEFSRRRLVALSAKSGQKLWAKDANYRHRPIIVGERVIAEPWAFDLHSGRQQMRVHPLTGAEVPWSILRPGHHCGAISASPGMLLFRSGFTGFYDLHADAGTRHFAGHRLGCWINAIPAGGLVIVPEASAGCVCMFSIASTVVMEPREPREPWSIYSLVGSATPVEHMGLNLGAPGDRRDARGMLWFAYPRPSKRLETRLDFALDLEPTFLAGGGYVSLNAESTEVPDADTPWLFTSFARGVTHLSVPLVGKDEPAARYKVKLYFADLEANERVFDVRIQGEKSEKPVTLTGGRKALVREIKDVQVTDNLILEFVSRVDNPSTNQMPILNAIEIVRTALDR